MAKQQILAVDDEADILKLITFNLQKEGYQIQGATTGEEAMIMARSMSPALILLDIMLPGISGLEVCKRLKKAKDTQAIPVVMLSAKGEEADIVTGLELGADDYITKPFSPRVLVARVNTALRRTLDKDQENDTLAIRDLKICPSRFEVLVKDEPVALTYSEFKTLHTLARQPGRVFTRYQIVDAVRGEDYAVTDRAVDVQMVSLRKKLKHCGKYIETIRGVGYRLKD